MTPSACASISRKSFFKLRKRAMGLPRVPPLRRRLVCPSPNSGWQLDATDPGVGASARNHVMSQSPYESGTVTFPALTESRSRPLHRELSVSGRSRDVTEVFPPPGAEPRLPAETHAREPLTGYFRTR